jgi:hypothetical protein
MWSKTYGKTLENIDVTRLWEVWIDVDRWSEWQQDIDEARLEGAFAAGSRFTLKPTGGPRVKIEILEVEPNRRFTDLTRFPLARMYGVHEFIPRDGAVEIRTTIKVEGPLAFIWRKIVAEGVANGLEQQTDWLIERARSLKPVRS